jgi:hypothetical protein
MSLQAGALPGMWFYVSLFYPAPRLTIPMTLVRCGGWIVAWQLLAAGAVAVGSGGCLQLGVVGSPPQFLPLPVPPAPTCPHLPPPAPTCRRRSWLASQWHKSSALPWQQASWRWG